MLQDLVSFRTSAECTARAKDAFLTAKHDNSLKTEESPLCDTVDSLREMSELSTFFSSSDERF
jgi:hypothetical protein